MQKGILEPEWRRSLAAKVKGHFQTCFSAEAIGAKWLAALELALTAPLPERPFAIKPEYSYDGRTFSMELRGIVLDGWFSLRGAGVRKVAFYGAGRHSSWLLPLLKGNPRPEIVAFIDDAAKTGATFEGRPSMPLSAFDPASVDMIVLNTDSCREAMLGNLRAAGVPEAKVFDFYKAFPPGPYPR